MINLQNVPSGELLNRYRDLLLRLGSDRSNAALDRQAATFEEEISRRMAW